MQRQTQGTVIRDIELTDLIVVAYFVYPRAELRTIARDLRF